MGYKQARNRVALISMKIKSRRSCFVKRLFLCQSTQQLLSCIHEILISFFSCLYLNSLWSVELAIANKPNRSYNTAEHRMQKRSDEVLGCLLTFARKLSTELSSTKNEISRKYLVHLWTFQDTLQQQQDCWTVLIFRSSLEIEMLKKIQNKFNKSPFLWL